MATESTTADPIPLATGEWRVVPTRSEVGFTTRAMGLFPVHGRFTAEGGELTIDEAGTASGELRVDTTSVKTGIGKRDKHLRSADFFEVEHHPQMRFELASLALDADGAAKLIGALQIRGKALPVNTPAQVTSLDSGELRIETTFNVDPRTAGFAFKRLPRNVALRAKVALERAS